jgi:hypothetical protein
MIVETIRVALKSISEMKKMGFKLRPGSDSIYIKDNLHINSTMSKKFGDGQLYSFIPNSVLGSKYTHYCEEDGYYYHRDWFDVPQQKKVVEVLFDPKEIV